MCFEAGGGKRTLASPLLRLPKLVENPPKISKVGHRARTDEMASEPFLVASFSDPVWAKFAYTAF